MSFMLRVANKPIMLYVFMLSVVMLNVVALCKLLKVTVSEILNLCHFRYWG